MSNEVKQLRPHDQGAESALLGSILIDPDAMTLLGDTISPESFYLTRHKWIFEAIRDLHQEGEPVDIVTISAKLQESDRFEGIGGEPTLINLVTAVPTSTNLMSYAKIVRDHHLNRSLIAAGQQVATLGWQNGEVPGDKLAEAQRIIFELKSESKQSLRPIKDIAWNVVDEVQEGFIPGIKTGFSDLDRLLNPGLGKGDLIVVASRPGMGKTSFMNMIALSAAIDQKKNLVIFSLEMTGEQLIQRMIAAETRIDSQRIRRGELGEGEWPSFMETVGKLSQTNLFVDDSSLIGPEQLLSRGQRIRMLYGLDLILVDYLQLMDTGGRSRVEEVTKISRGLKMLAKELNVPVIAASQLSRSVEQRQDKRPLLSDLRDSGSIEQDADIVMFIYRDDYYHPDTTERPNVAEISIAKNRHGPTGIVDLFWHSKCTAFRNLARQTIDLNTATVVKVSEPTHIEKSADKY